MSYWCCECWWSSSGNIYGVCWLEAWSGINVEDVTTSWDCKVYKISSLVNITSPDGSISINKVWNNFEIEGFSSSDDSDKLVAVKLWDTPWYLENKIVSTCNNILTVTPTFVGWQWVLDLCVDIDSISWGVGWDGKVKVSWVCDSKYLAEALWTYNPNYFTFEQDACNLVFTAKKSPRPMLIAEVIVTPSWEENFWRSNTLSNGRRAWVIWSTYWYTAGNTSAWTINTNVSAAWSWDGNTTTFSPSISGYYMISLTADVSTTMWVNAVRIAVQEWINNNESQMSNESNEICSATFATWLVDDIDTWSMKNSQWYLHYSDAAADWITSPEPQPIPLVARSLTLSTSWIHYLSSNNEYYIARKALVDDTLLGTNDYNKNRIIFWSLRPRILSGVDGFERYNWSFISRHNIRLSLILLDGYTWYTI